LYQSEDFLGLKDGNKVSPNLMFNVMWGELYSFINRNKCKRKQNKQNSRLQEHINGPELRTPTDTVDLY